MAIDSSKNNFLGFANKYAMLSYYLSSKMVDILGKKLESIPVVDFNHSTNAFSFSHQITILRNTDRKWDWRIAFVFEKVYPGSGTRSVSILCSDYSDDEIAYNNSKAQGMHWKEEEIGGLYSPHTFLFGSTLWENHNGWKEEDLQKQKKLWDDFTSFVNGEKVFKNELGQKFYIQLC
ncbi:hypothetical protein BN1013_01983 [Candidatus Rubidus massiliensis]|nr:hypothetical protein BN1013_01983 [Candidatus Rubidus massiliensis]